MQVGAWRKKNAPKLSVGTFFGNSQHNGKSLNDWKKQQQQQKKQPLREIKTRIWHPHTLAYILRKPLMKRCMNPRYAAALLLLPSPGSLCSLQDSPKNLRDISAWGKEKTLIEESADQEDGRLVPWNNHLVRAWLPGSFMGQKWGGRWENNIKRLFSPCKCPLE